ncbi:hypothetical protein ABZZ20_02740 [Streptomyces sp. NPDC006430]|uniref:hypothetical protein n=1 Tax=Streptomyces sp. NPDC006430 TaxID=3154299 RepID=UPI0033A90F49
MYEMQIGEAAAGSGPVWHVVARDHRATLCGRPLQPGGNAETDRHCAPCMTAFQYVMQQASTE